MKKAFQSVSCTVAALAMTACAGTSYYGQEDGLYYAGPQQMSQDNVASALSVDDVASIFSQAGFSGVRKTSNAVRASTTSNAMVDCGVLTQVALGNQSNFEGIAPKAAIISSGDLVLREFAVQSSIKLTRGEESVYAVTERHRVTLRYLTPDGLVTSREIKTFGATDQVMFSDGTACNSAGVSRSLL